MGLEPKKFREYVLQLLYAESMNAKSTESKDVMALLKVSKKLSLALLDYTSQITSQFETLDQEIQELSKEWSLKRISHLELQILRFGLFEFKKKELDNAIIIAEMIRLCKKFSTNASSEYIHAILDAYMIKGKSVEE